MTTSAPTMRMLFRSLFLVILLLSFGGCFRAMLLDSDALRHYSGEDIVVSTKDGGKYRFDSGDWTITHNATGEEAITGTGKAYRGDGSEFENFQGEIPVSDIDKVTTRRTTPVFYVSIAVVVITVGIGIWFALSIQRGFGG